MTNYLGSFLAITVLLHRFLLWTLPFFTQALQQYPVRNLACGLFADISLLALMGLVGIGFKRFFGRRWQPGRLSYLGAALLLGLWSLLWGAHLRYVEHFGTSLRTFHLLNLFRLDFLQAGFGILASSWRIWPFLALGSLGVMLGFIFAWQAPQTKRSIFIAKPKGGYAWLAFLVFGLCSHALVIQLRQKVGVHKELCYHLPMAFFMQHRQYQEYKDHIYAHMANDRELVALRDILPGQRYFSAQSNEEYPLWQEKLATTSNGQGRELRDKLKSYLAAEKQQQGPWNVILVIAESLRAHELASFREPQTVKSSDEPLSLTPHIDKLTGQGIRFSEVISSGLQTHYGQTATFCSLYSFEDRSLMLNLPQAHAVCLGDIFASKRYRTFFFYGADNHFDNQDIFYQHHRMQEVHGEERLSPAAAKGGWGYSDHALFEHALAHLKGASEPFFATILTLTNHAPYRLPEDAPDEVKAQFSPLRAEHERLLPYVDWAFDDFYKQVREFLPHTLLLLVADHGVFGGEKLGPDLTYPQLRKIARIPLLILLPGMPEELQGQSISHLASNVDIAPTLLGLLGWDQVPQQFMGTDAFTREGPVFIYWNGEVKRLLPQGGGIQAETLALTFKAGLGSLVHFNRLAPPSYGSQLSTSIGLE